MNKQLYVIYKQKLINSRYGNKVIQIDMLGIEDRQIWTTYIDPMNWNFKFWSHIVMNPLYGYLISNVVVKNPTKALVSADSKIIIEYQAQDQDEIFNELILKWQKQDANQFEKLFE